MKLQAWLMLGLLGINGAAFAEGGCPPNQVPQNYGSVVGCAPISNASQQAQQQPQQSLPPQPSGYWEKTWGAIAPSPVGGILGTVVGASSKEEAEQLALADCKAKGGTACEIGLAYHNQCAAMALGEKTYSLAHAASVEEAKDLGLDDCKKNNGSCNVYYSACTEPIFNKF